jgi:intracellular septation protein A
MTQALAALTGDLFSAILFVLVYLATGSVTLAAALAIAAGAAQRVYLRLSGQPIQPMQWMSLGLVIVLGSAALVTQSPRFVMVKPSIGHFAVALMLLRRGWMIRYLPERLRDSMPEAALVASGYAWAALLAALGAANLVVALYADMTTWVWFISVMAGAKITAFAAQVLVFRIMLRRSLRPAS